MTTKIPDFPPSSRDQFGGRLGELMDSHCISSAVLARAADVDRSVIDDIRSGRTKRPQPATIDKLVVALNQLVRSVPTTSPAEVEVRVTLDTATFDIIGAAALIASKPTEQFLAEFAVKHAHVLSSDENVAGVVRAVTEARAPTAGGTADVPG